MNLDFSVSWIGILVSVIFSVVLGFLWYGPLFGRKWMMLMGINPKDVEKPKQKGMAKEFLLMIIVTIIAVYVFDLVLINIGVENYLEGLIGGFLIWIGFIATRMIDGVLWEKKPVSLYFLNVSYQFVTYLVMGMILGFFH